jgi:protein-tyrosine phosphatase
VKILFVCLGNICRSPSAEGVMRKLVSEAGLQGSIKLHSAGMGPWHVGEPPDPRATEAARARGIVLEGQGRQVEVEDFERFDLIVAMDRSNEQALIRLAPDEHAREKIHLMREFDPANMGGEDLDVPDPYYEGSRGFETVLDLLQSACAGLLERVRTVESA